MTASDSGVRRKSAGNRLIPWLVLPIALLLLPIALVRGVLRGLHAATLYARVWSRHARWIVFVTSDSPKWKEHVETRILPLLPAGAVVVNRSKPWSKASLEGRVFRHFGGQHDYCPIGLVFERGKRVRTFRFFRAFQQAHQGDASALEDTQAAFEAAVGHAAHESPTMRRQR